MAPRIGTETLVNSSHGGPQSQADAAVLGDGGYVVVWAGRTYAETGTIDPFRDNASGIVMQRFTAEGVPLGPETAVNQPIGQSTGSIVITDFGTQRAPQVAARPDGGFIVWWHGDDISNYTDSRAGPSRVNVLARLYGPDGQPQGDMFRVNTTALNEQQAPRLAHLADGDFVLVWEDRGPIATDDLIDLRARIFAADGTPRGPDFLLHEVTLGNQRLAEVMGLADGGFAVSWLDGSQKRGAVTYDRALVRAFDADGTPRGEAGFGRLKDAEIGLFRTVGWQQDPRLLALADGGFALAFTDNDRFNFGDPEGAGTDYDGASIRLQLFEADGARRGADILVNGLTARDQSVPEVAQLADGRILVVWRDKAPTRGSEDEVRAALFTPQGVRLGAEIVVHAGAGESVFQAGRLLIEPLADGGFAIGWNRRSGGSDAEVALRIFDAEGVPTGPMVQANTATLRVQTLDALAVLPNGRIVTVWTDDSRGTGGDDRDSFSTAVKQQHFAGPTDEILGTPGPDTLQGGTGADTIRGFEGDDLILAGAGADLAYGGAGNDRLLGEGGDDTLYGGDGADTLNGGDGDDFLFGGDTDADLRDVIYGGDGHDHIDGGAGNDELHGGAGHDTIIGGLGSDSIYGNEGNDLLSGGGGSDLIFGGAGDDWINGGFGFDRLNGGAGADTFFHQGVPDHGSDWIQDYRFHEGDVLAVGIAGATRDQFQVNFATTPGAGAADVAEAFVIHRPTQQILFALIDGAGQDGIRMQAGGQVFDLLA